MEALSFDNILGENEIETLSAHTPTRTMTSYMKN